mgnify:CR=1 FL=1
MAQYQATHKIYEDGEFKYLWDNTLCAVLTKSGNFHIHLSRDWGDSVLKGGRKHYRFEEIFIDLENK